MELSQEEIDKFMADKMETGKRMREGNKRYKEIMKLFNSSQLTNISPI